MEKETEKAETTSVILGDALENLRLMADNSAGAVITDPPYGVQAKGSDWDVCVPSNEVLAEFLRISNGPVIWFGANLPRAVREFMKYDPLPDRILIWRVTMSLAHTAKNGMFYRWHPIYCWRPHDQCVLNSDILEFPQDGHNWWNHIGTKPIKLMIALVRAFSRSGDLVIDPYCGSGSTLVACEMTGRRSIGIDNDPESIGITLKRLHDERAQLKLDMGDFEKERTRCT